MALTHRPAREWPTSHRRHRGQEWAQWCPSQAAHVLGQDIGDSWVVASAINNFGELAHYRGDYDTAVQFYRESQELFRQINSAVALFAAVYTRFDQPGTTLCPADRELMWNAN